VCSPAIETQLAQLEAQGKTVIVLTDGNEPLILLAVADTIKDSSRVAIRNLHELGIETVMLTGDNSRTAAAIAQQVGIDKALGDQLPEDKLRRLNAISAMAGLSAWLATASTTHPLSRADIGFAMGAAGSDTAIETADVALMDDDLQDRPLRAAFAQNAGRSGPEHHPGAWYQAIFLALTLAGFGTMWMAVFADMGASLIVVANGLRLVRQ
jgi:Cd2+/Zn2+-exporting ATPase